jgi:FdhD protein
MPSPSVASTEVLKFKGKEQQEQSDLLAVEEPMEIRLGYGKGVSRKQKTVSVTMRTPGNDFELAVGFLYTEGILTERSQVDHIRYCFDNTDQEQENIVRVELREGIEPNLDSLERNFYMNSSCGVCGKASIESIETTANCPVIPKGSPKVSSEIFQALPERLRQEQLVFEHTGGLHAVGIFTAEGELLYMREDVGRHNAFDKAVGAAFLEEKLPLFNQVALVSGRASFELVQKSVMAGIPILAAIGAPSSLAVDLSKQFGTSLIGFLKQDKMNLYTNPHRIQNS